MTSEEDEWVSAMLDYWSGSLETSVEHHYNHYGSRGVVDLYAHDHDVVIVFEVKSDAALMSSTGANEIIRQFNKHKTYFFESESLPIQRSGTVSFELTFIPSERTTKHVRDHLSMYETAVQELPEFLDTIDVVGKVCFRVPKQPEHLLTVLKNSTGENSVQRLKPTEWGADAAKNVPSQSVHGRVYELTKDW